MTNFFQYLDICADTMKRLRDQGITPHGMAIVVDDRIMDNILQMVDGKSGYVNANLVKGEFTVEVVNRGYMRIQLRDYKFSVTRYREESDGKTENIETAIQRLS